MQKNLRVAVQIGSEIGIYRIGNVTKIRKADEMGGGACARRPRIAQARIDTSKRKRLKREDWQAATRVMRARPRRQDAL
jgi:hypothetical protein